jgi:hypothetical protein
MQHKCVIYEQSTDSCKAASLAFGCSIASGMARAAPPLRPVNGISVLSCALLWMLVSVVWSACLSPLVAVCFALCVLYCDCAAVGHSLSDSVALASLQVFLNGSLCSLL